MDAQTQASNTRLIARNTVLLYVRMLFLLLIGLYTSRVVLHALGETDAGIYNVVGGVVALFSVISGALSAAITRFLTFEMGKSGDNDKLAIIFSSSVTIQLFIALIIVILAEPVGIWYIANKMTIDPARIPAANWVLQFSILTFVIDLVSVPYNAAIIAHERMKGFAAIGIGEGLGKLAVALVIARCAGDRLILYAALMCVVAVGVRLAYGIYCRRFPECRFRFCWDGALLKQMFSFAGWNFIGASSGVIKDQGATILINHFSGLGANAARWVALQLSGAVQNFSTNFMTALNPQITKFYAAGEKDYVEKLLFKGAKFSFYLLLLLGLPVLMNTEYLMGLWLKEVPEHAVSFARLALVLAMCECLSKPLITAMLATGDIKLYQIIVGGLQLLNIPVSYVCLKLGCGPESVFWVAIIISQICLGARLILLKGMIGLPSLDYLKTVYLNVILVSALSASIPLQWQRFLPDGGIGCLCSCLICLVWTALVMFFVGLTPAERKTILLHLRRKKNTAE